MSPFVQLLERVHAIDGIERIRFTSPHPRGFKHDLVEAYGRLPKLCGYVHLPMQSGSNRILRAMNRPYTRERYLEIVAALRAVRPDMYFSTDVIVGFPGETEEDFARDPRALRGGELRHGLCLQVFRPHRHARRGDGRPGPGRGQGGAQPHPARPAGRKIPCAATVAYHGARAKDPNFNITVERSYDKDIAPVELVPQDMTRVFLNLFGNGFYGATKRRRETNDVAFIPVLTVSTRDLGAGVEVRVRDNGVGVPAEIADKLFQPFFTTKPPGEGTGLGLSISYEIVTKQHGGTINFASDVGEFAEFTVCLPRRLAAKGAAQTSGAVGES